MRKLVVTDVARGDLGGIAGRYTERHWGAAR